jgi:four helix bundle protein
LGRRVIGSPNPNSKITAMKIKKFEDLDCWQEARTLTKSIYDTTKNGPFKQDYGLADQARRASTSIMANIAEGFSRQGDREFTQFLFIAKASASELQSHLYVAFDQGYIDRDHFQFLSDQLEHIHKQISNLIKYLRSCSSNN